MTVHRLKSWPENFAAIENGSKTFDLRRDDRGFETGDEIVFEEFRPGVGEYTGARTTKYACYIERSTREVVRDGLAPGFCIIGLT
jgi:hypothetical protein